MAKLESGLGSQVWFLQELDCSLEDLWEFMGQEIRGGEDLRPGDRRFHHATTLTINSGVPRFVPCAGLIEHVYDWRLPKSGATPKNHPHFNRIVSYKPSILEYPPFMEPPNCSYTSSLKEMGETPQLMARFYGDNEDQEFGLGGFLFGLRKLVLIVFLEAFRS